MAKKLINRYTFTPSENKLVIKGAYSLERFLIITNTTANESMFIFNSNTQGIATHSINTLLDETTITLDHDCSTYSATDTIQIFVEKDYQEMEPSESLIDPVNKLRVSNPQNLIDTDFEYGLQPSKWETIELVNNIPSFYASSSDYIIPDVVSVEIFEGSENVIVTTLESHNISVGAPIDVQGLGVRTAEGKFLVTQVPNATQFIYKSKGVQSESKDISGIYTTIIPGQFYTNSDIQYSNETGVATDEGTPSKLIINTNYDHGFEVGSSLYVTNTVAKKKFSLTDTTTSTAPDGRPYVDFENTRNITFNLDTSLTETRAMRGTYQHKFTSADVNVTTNAFNWPSHQLQTGDALLFMNSAGDQIIGGLAHFKVYYVKNVIDSDNFTVCETTNGAFSTNAEIDITSAGTSTYGRHSWSLVYEIRYLQKPANSYPTYLYTRAAMEGTTQYSGRDLYSSGYSVQNGRGGYYGLGNAYPTRVWMINTDGTNFGSTYFNSGYFPYYSTSQNANFTTGYDSSGAVTPNGYDFMDDWQRYENYRYGNNYYNYWNFNQGNMYANYINGFNRNVSGTAFVNHGTTFMMFLDFDDEAETFYYPNHGLIDGGAVTVTTTAGSNMVTRTETSTNINATPTQTTRTSPISSTVSVVSDNRFRISDVSRITTAAGTYSLSGVQTNATKNTLYIPGYDLFDGQAVKLRPAAGGGVLPTVDSGVIDPTSSNITGAYSALTGYLDSFILNTMGGQNNGDHVNLQYTGNSDYYPVQSSRVFYEGGYQRVYFYTNNLSLYQYSNAISANVTLSQQTGWRNGRAWNPFEGTVHSSSGFRAIHTPYSSGGETPYFIDMYYVPDPDPVNSYNYMQFYTDGNGYNYFQTTERSGSQSAMTNLPLGNGWQYSWYGIIADATTTYHGFMSFAIELQNTGWGGYYSSYTGQLRYDGNSSRTPLINGYTYGGERYRAYVYIPLRVNTATGDYSLTTGTKASIQTIAQDAATAIANALTKPSLNTTASNDVFAKTVSGTRLAFQNDYGVEYDFTNSGTATIEVETFEEIGGADGYFDISAVSTNQIQLDTSATIEARQIDFVDTDISNYTDYGWLINKTDHRLKTGQVITYYATSGSVDNLTNAYNYYVYAVGPDHFGLADTYQNAISQQILDLTNATGTHYIKAPTVSAISLASGTVDIEQNDPKVIGTDTSFKRYFKPGDIIRIKDVSTTPATFREFEISTVVDETEMTLSTVSENAITNGNFYVDTKVNVRPDGTFLHRPFDGGVEINAGTSPNSSIVRQTRKYFRYQSGKGIQVSLAINFNPARIATRLTGSSSSTTATVRTSYPHGLVAGNEVTIAGANDDTYNGTFTVDSADAFTFSYTMSQIPQTSLPKGIISYNIATWANAFVRAGLFDYQNGMFFEYDGSELYAVRRSSVQQLPGTVAASKNSNIIYGSDTQFDGQLQQGDYVVIRGMSYRVTSVKSDTEIHIQPSYRGVTAENIIITKTIDVKVPKSQWNIDRADGTGPSGYDLDITKIQMAYIDYSWYGAGKIRFGFKDTYGHVRYMHEFIHNNKLEEAYMRSGNIPARYEIYNSDAPTYVPGLFHWGTSIIMDGTFDDDKAYLFTAASNTLIFTNGDVDSATTSGNSSLDSRWNSSQRRYDYYLRIPFNSIDASKFSTGAALYTTDDALSGEQVSFTSYSGGYAVYIYLQTSRNPPTVYPNITSGTVVSIGGPATGGTTVDLTNPIPVISIRLAPSVDNNLTGALGAREIINRMQLQLKSLGITLTHDCEVDVILNANIDNTNFQTVDNPSLSQLLRHEGGDRLVGGSKIFSFRASGGTETNGERLSSTSEFDLSQITDLGNSIVGGDGVFPNGPDLLTITIQPVDTGSISSASPLKIASRVTWTESQA